MKKRVRTEYNRQWREKNKDMVNRRASPNFARWREENRAKRLAWEAAYRRTEAYRAKNRINQAKRNAQKKNAEGSHTPAEFHAVLIAQAFRCFYCGTDITDRATKDHFIPLSKGGSDYIENIRGACLACNISKSNRDAPKRIKRDAV